MSNAMPDDVSQPLSPTVVVYQTADFEDSSTSGKEGKSEKKFKTGARADVFPWPVGINAQAGYGHEQGATEEVAARRHNKFVYSQEYYLDHVRSGLRDRELITQVHGAADASSLPVGAFIEFEAKFEANEVNTILDILTPELSAAITRYIKKNQGIREMDAIRQQAADSEVEISVDKLSAIRAIYEAQAENQAAFAMLGRTS